jgi:hypothetical protein
MTCELTTTVSRRSTLGRPALQFPPAGTIQPCDLAAQRVCPETLEAVCNNHSRSVTTPAGIRRGDRACSACGRTHSRGAWLGL